MERLCNLFFELSNKGRLRILLELEKKPMRLTPLSEKLGLTIQELHRHLSRLSDTKLIKKGSDGFYRPTSYGEHTMRLLSGFEFLSKHREYFTTHKASHLPNEFMSRIGDLVNCTFIDDVMVVFHSTDNMIQEAEEYVWILSDQILMSTRPFLERAVKRGVEFRVILPEDLIPPPGFKRNPVIDKAMKMRVLKKIEVVIAMSDKHPCHVVFPTIDGKMDYFAFKTTDERSHKWCRDLFLHYWEKARPEKPKDYPPP